MPAPTPLAAARSPLAADPFAASGRYAVFHGGLECGEERWRIESASDAAIVTGEQVTWAPHPFPSRQEYRVTLDLAPRWRVNGLEIRWTVGPRVIRSLHAAEAARWRVRIDAGGRTREQEGDYPEFCEVDFGTPLFNTFTLARYSFAIGAEIEFPVLRIGPPILAVTPARQKYQCVEAGERDLPFGRVAARRFVLSDPDGPSDRPLAFWADEHDIVLEILAGLDPADPWMRLVEYRRGR